MKISSDLIDALLMLSCIILVLVGTTSFENPTNKTIIMVVLGIIAISSAVLRVIKMKNGQDTTQH